MKLSLQVWILLNVCCWIWTVDSILRPSTRNCNLLLSFELLAIFHSYYERSIGNAVVEVLLEFVHTKLVRTACNHRNPVAGNFPSVLNVASFSQLLSIHISNLYGSTIAQSYVLNIVYGTATNLTEAILSLSQVATRASCTLSIPEKNL